MQRHRERQSGLTGRSQYRWQAVSMINCVSCASVGLLGLRSKTSKTAEGVHVDEIVSSAVHTVYWSLVQGVERTTTDQTLPCRCGQPKRQKQQLTHQRRSFWNHEVILERDMRSLW